MTLPAPPAWYATLCAAARLRDDWTPAGLDHLNWALSRAPGPPLSLSGLLEHTTRTQPARRLGAIRCPADPGGIWDRTGPPAPARAAASCGGRGASKEPG